MQINKEEIEILIETKIQAAEKKYGSEFKTCLIEILSLEKMIAPQNNDTESEKFIPVPKWNDFHPYPTESALRMLIFYAETNGFKSVIHRRGKRVFIKEQAFFEWLKTHKNEAEQT